jgi:hypothetical protein
MEIFICTAVRIITSCVFSRAQGFVTINNGFWIRVSSEVFTAVTLKSSAFWNPTPWSILSVPKFRRNALPPSSVCCFLSNIMAAWTMKFLCCEAKWWFTVNEDPHRLVSQDQSNPGRPGFDSRHWQVISLLRSVQIGPGVQIASYAIGVSYAFPRG